MRQSAIIVGNSDGIGLALTRNLLQRGWRVSGLSRSPSPVEHRDNTHRIVDVRSNDFVRHMKDSLDESTRLVIYCAGVGEKFDFSRPGRELATFETNLMGLVKTATLAIPHFLAHKTGGVLVGLSSMADIIRSGTSPAYGASKAGMSHYLESLALALRHSDVRVVNVRLGFVATKMAKASRTPWILEPETAAARILRAALADSPPRRLNIPRRMAAAAQLARVFGHRS